MWRLAILAACVVAAVSEDGLQLRTDACVYTDTSSGTSTPITFTVRWDNKAGECDFVMTDASKKEVESIRATGKAKISIKDVGRYMVKVDCDKGSEALYFDAIFIQPESANKRIIATAFPSKTSAYVSFSSSEPDAQFTCQLDTGDPAACESPWHSTDTLSAGPHSLTINPSTDPAQGLQIPFVVGENY